MCLLYKFNIYKLVDFQTLCEMMNLKDFIGLEEFPLFDIAKRMKENHEYRIQQDTSGGMSMMTNDGNYLVITPNRQHKELICSSK